MSDWTTDPAEIPDSGERYDMTLSKMGFARNHGVDDDNPTKLVITCVIDNGDHDGFKVSHSFLITDTFGGFGKFLDGTGLLEEISDEKLWFLQNKIKPGVKMLKDEIEKEHRFSAILHVEEVEKESERLAVYSLSDFDDPQQEATLHLQTEPQQFRR